jgi:S-adenosylmethionine-diacylglycerol 3-amino-3-carboxypropyl transferase
VKSPVLDPGAAPIVHFSETWEDPLTCAAALDVQPSDAVLAITAGGCTPLSLLCAGPRALTSLDYNPAQTHLLELKTAALRALSADEVEPFLRRGSDDPGVYRRVRAALGPEAAAFWDARRPTLDAGVAASGRATRLFYAIGRFLRRVFEPDFLEGFFEADSFEEQQWYYDDHFDHPRVRFLSCALGPLLSKRAVLSRLLRADYFPYATMRNIPEFLWERVEHALTRVPVADNYFLSRIFVGHDLPTPEGRPPYLQPPSLARIGGLLDRLHPVTASLTDHLRTLPDGSVDKLDLSNVFEWMPEHRMEEVFLGIHRVCTPGARLVFRNLFTDRTVPASLGDRFRVDAPLSERLHAADRSLIYSRTCVVEVNK